jgi:Fur family ferric uptake transcriptional regulator
MDETSHFRRFLKDNALTFTSTREAILGGLSAFSGHFDADELQEALRKRGERLSTATIYRTLPLFVKSGIIKETIGSGGRARYERALGLEHHDHLECIRCGRIIEFKDDGLEALQDTVCKKHGFTPTEHRLAIKGYCSSCGKKKR